MKKFLRGGVWLTAGNVFSTSASFLRNIFIARLVSVEDFGIVALLALALSTVETISNIAIDRLLVQAPDGDDPELQANSHALQVARGIIGGLVVYLCAPWLAALFKISDATWAFRAGASSCNPQLHASGYCPFST
jgi:O-antigen/teichoic acid export membrane protein